MKTNLSSTILSGGSTLIKLKSLPHSYFTQIVEHLKA
jgi:hypothetical protein